MQPVCIACKKRYFYREGDEDCTEFLCEECMSMNPQKNLGSWSRLRFRILQRDNFSCKYCGASTLNTEGTILHIDHIMPVSRCGTNSEKNLITSCALCNLGKLAFELNNKNKCMANEYLNSGKVKEALKNGKDK